MSLLAHNGRSRLPPIMLNPLTTSELVVPVARMRGTGAAGVPIVIAVADVDLWMASMSPEGILSFTRGRVGEGSGASFRPQLTVIKPGHTIVTLTHTATKSAYTISVTVPNPNDGGLRRRALSDPEDSQQESQALVDEFGEGDGGDDDPLGEQVATRDDSAAAAESRRSLLDHVGLALRRLVGSNCVQIEYAKVSRYYTCVGCIVEEAMGCMDDLRQNRSANVSPACKMNKLREGNQKEQMEIDQQGACCPKFDGAGKLVYMQSAFNTALNCIRTAGCAGSEVFKNLLNECSHMCDRVSADEHNANQAAGNPDNGWYDDTLQLDPNGMGTNVLYGADSHMFDTSGSVCLSYFAAAPIGARMATGLPLLLSVMVSLMIMATFR